MSNNKEFYNVMKEYMLQFKSYKELLGSKEEACSQLVRAYDKINIFEFYKDLVGKDKKIIAIITIALLTNFPLWFIANKAIIFVFLFFLETILLVKSIVSFHEAKTNLLWYSELNNLSDLEIQEKKEELELAYQKAVDDIDELEYKIKDIDKKIHSYPFEYLKELDSRVESINKMFDESLSESIDYKNVHLVLDQIDFQRDKNLIKIYGKK